MNASLKTRIMLLFTVFTFICNLNYSQDLIKDFHVGDNLGSNIYLLVSYNNQLLFGARNNGENNRFWRTDGTFEGTSIVHPLYKSYSGYESFLNVSDAFLFRDKLYLEIIHANKTEYWETDGTTEGTMLSNPMGEDCTIPSYMGQTDVPEFLRLNNSVFFRCGLDYFKADGTKYSLDNSGFMYWEPKAITEWKNHLIFSKSNYELYITDSLPSGVKEITNIEVKLYNNQAIGVDGLVFFSGKSSGYGCELWCYSEIKDSTYLVKDIEPGTSGSYPDRFIAINGKVIFSVGLGTYISDGTSEGTYPLFNLHVFQVENYPFYIHYMNKLYFTAQDGAHGYELWATDGSLEGTELIKDIIIGDMSSGSFPSGFVEYNGEFYFNASNGSNTGIWKSDGTTDGTVPVLLAGPAKYFTVNNNLLYMVLNDGEHGNELWVSDGTEQGSHIVRDINPNTYLSPRILGKIDNGLIVSSYANDTSYLYTSDGSNSGTTIYHKEYSPRPEYFMHSVEMNNKIFYNSTNKYLCVTDGTEDGNECNKNISNPKNFFKFKDKVYFSADYDWKSKLFTSTEDISTAALFCGAVDSEGCIELDTIFFFLADDRAEIWRSNGTVEGTYKLKDFSSDYSVVSDPTVFNDLLFFIAPGETASTVLWSTDGTLDGTLKILHPDGSEIKWSNGLTVRDSSLFISTREGTLRIDANSSDLIEVENFPLGQVIGNKMYFIGFLSPGEYEPWCGDVSSGETWPLTNRNGDESSNPKDFIGFGDKVYFTLFDQNYGRELWLTDGTEGNAELFFDADPGFGSGDPNGFTLYKDDLYFFADNGIQGRNLYKIKQSATNNIAQIIIKKSQIHVYPNPFLSQTTIEFDNPNHRNYNLLVYNLTGKKVYEINNITSDKTELKRGNLKAGIYFIGLKGNRVFENKMILIR